jgi:hypothetical protein
MRGCSFFLFLFNSNNYTIYPLDMDNEMNFLAELRNVKIWDWDWDWSESNGAGAQYSCRGLIFG